MGKDYCSIFECHNFSGRVGKFSKKVVLHKMPKDPCTRKAWVMAISRKNWFPTLYTRVCSDHFADGIGPNSVNRKKVPTENFSITEDDDCGAQSDTMSHHDPIVSTTRWASVNLLPLILTFFARKNA
ncbi:hypothetical protein DPMN_143240 [Dreissena polymorpha]|uniref:THAP-type domain-containing protein n=1 Tax=Dreissena polymorpha TaxID=45954 RepID=A0A9D4JJI1_DREPO|nr:hypothetical protein DPMN_143240 [Dreissena polymorpha]